MDFSWQRVTDQRNAVEAEARAKAEAAKRSRDLLHAQFTSKVIRPFFAAMNQAGNPGLIKCLDKELAGSMAGKTCKCGWLGPHKAGWLHPDRWRNHTRIYLNGNYFFDGGEHFVLANDRFDAYTARPAEEALITAQHRLIDILQANNVPVPRD